MPLKPVANKAIFNTRDFFLFDILNTEYLYFPYPPERERVEEELL